MSHIPHLLKEPKFPSQFIPEYIRLLERFEVVLSQTPQTLLIPSRLPRAKPSSVTLPPASPGCEKMSFSFLTVFLISFQLLLPPSSLPPHFLAVFLISFNLLLPPSSLPPFSCCIPHLLPPSLTSLLSPSTFSCCISHLLSFSSSLPPHFLAVLFIFSPYTLLSPSTAQIIRRYLFLYIPPGFWPRLVARLIAFPKRILPHCIKVGIYLIHSTCDSLLMSIVREIWKVNWRCGLRGSTISGLR